MKQTMKLKIPEIWPLKLKAAWAALTWTKTFAFTSVIFAGAFGCALIGVNKLYRDKCALQERINLTRVIQYHPAHTNHMNER